MTPHFNIMEFKKEYEDIIDEIDHESFDSLTNGLNKILDLLEKNSEEASINQELYAKVILKAEELKDEASKLLKKQGQEIVNTANLFGIPLSEIGFSLSDLQFDQ